MKNQRCEAAISVAEYTGHWLECRNPKCGFPVRVPDFSPSGPRRKAPSVLFACPICLEVNPYASNDLRDVEFRSPDPYQAGKLVLYSVLLGCSQPRCQGQATVMTAAAASVSLAVLLRLWKLWKVNFSCDGTHGFRPRHPHTWWIQEEKTLAWPKA